MSANWLEIFLLFSFFVTEVSEYASYLIYRRGLTLKCALCSAVDGAYSRLHWHCGGTTAV